MHILTFDIEEWFHILDNPSTRTENEWEKFESRIHKNVDRILEILSKHNQKATFFCLGWIASKYPEVIKSIHKYGHEIGSHSNNHQLVYEQSPKAFEKDLETSIKLLQDITGERIIAYRAPGFSINSSAWWVFEYFEKYGIEIDCSIFPANRAHGGIKDFSIAKPFIIDANGYKIKEFPLNTLSFLGKKIIFSGGGYFRLFPYPLLNVFSKYSDYIMTYFHPRDFDDGQPLINNLSLNKRFKSYVGIKTAQKKLEQWLRNYPFYDLRTANQAIDWNSVPIYDIITKKII